VFCSESQDLPVLVGQICAVSGGVPLIGCTTAGEIVTSGPREASVVVAALGGDGFRIETAVATGASSDLRAAGACAARCLPSPVDRPYRALLLWTDGLAGDQQEIVRGAYAVLGAGVPQGTALHVTLPLADDWALGGRRRTIQFPDRRW
jgi:hypothetical protein